MERYAERVRMGRGPGRSAVESGYRALCAPPERSGKTADEAGVDVGCSGASARRAQIRGIFDPGVRSNRRLDSVDEAVADKPPARGDPLLAYATQDRRRAGGLSATASTVLTRRRLDLTPGSNIPRI